MSDFSHLHPPQAAAGHIYGEPMDGSLHVRVTERDYDRFQLGSIRSRVYLAAAVPGTLDNLIARCDFATRSQVLDAVRKLRKAGFVAVREAGT